MVRKIFDEGLRNCRAFLVVLSNNSIHKPWVREELDAAMVRKIEEHAKLIPVRLDGCEVPESLRHTCWVDIPDLSGYEQEFQRILNAIFGMYDRPPVGEPPAYVQESGPEYEQLSRIDGIVFTIACKRAVETASRFIDREWLSSATKALGISEEQVMDCQDVMENRGYLELHRVIGPRHIYEMTITESGFNQYARAQPEYKRAMETVGLMIVRDGCDSSRRIAEKCDLPERFIEHALFVLEQNGYIRTTTMLDGEVLVDSCSPELRRDVEP